MKKIAIILLLITTLSFDTQKEEAYTVGEYLKYRVHYGIISAGYATIEVKDATLNNQSVYHVIGKGFSTGMTKLFFKVEDVYESFIDKNNRTTYKFVRKINEGGYTKSLEGFVDQISNKINVNWFLICISI